MGWYTLCTLIREEEPNKQQKMKKIILAALFLFLIAGVYGVGYSEDGSGFATFGGTRMCMSDGSVPLTGTWDFSNATVSISNLTFNNIQVNGSINGINYVTNNNGSDLTSKILLGGKIIIPCGVYNFSGLTNIPSNTYIQGSGACTYLNFIGASAGIGAESKENITIKDLIMNHNSGNDNTTNYQGFRWHNTNNVYMSNVILYNASHHGFWVNGGNNTIFENLECYGTGKSGAPSADGVCYLYTNAWNWSLIDSIAMDTGYHGIQCKETSGKGLISNVKVQDIGNINPSAGFLKTQDSCGNIIVSDLFGSDTPQNGVIIEGTDSFTLDGLHLDYVSTYGVRLTNVEKVSLSNLNLQVGDHAVYLESSRHININNLIANTTGSVRSCVFLASSEVGYVNINSANCDQFRYGIRDGATGTNNITVSGVAVTGQVSGNAVFYNGTNPSNYYQVASYAD